MLFRRITSWKIRAKQEVQPLTFQYKLHLKTCWLPSPSKADIRSRAEKLDSFYDKIIGCRVLVEAPHHHHRAGQRCHVRIDLTVPGEEIVINRAPRLIAAKPLADQEDVEGIELEESREPSKYAVP